MQINIDNTELFFKHLYNYLLKLKKEFVTVGDYIDNSFTISYGCNRLALINYNKASNCIYIYGKSNTNESALIFINSFCYSPCKSLLLDTIKYFNLLIKCKLI